MSEPNDIKRITRKAIRDIERRVQLHKNCIRFMEKEQVNRNTTIKALKGEMQKIDKTTEEGQERTQKIERLITLFGDYIKGSRQTVEMTKKAIGKDIQHIMELEKEAEE